MQMSDGFAAVETGAASSFGAMGIVIAALAALCAGGAIAGVVYAVGASMRVDVGGARKHLTEARREMAKVNKGMTDSLIFNLGMTVLPLFKPLGAIPIDSLKRDWGERASDAGWPGGLDEDDLFAAAIGVSVSLAFAFSGVGFLLLGIKGTVAGVVGLLAGFYLFGTSITGIAKGRLHKVGRSMPYVVDLLVLTMRAGASFGMAMERVAADYRYHPIGQEFTVTLREINAGTPRKQAFQNMAERTPLPVVRTFVDEIIQSEELGRGISDTLERMGERIRVRRKQDAADIAGKAKVNVLAPSVLALVGILLLMFSTFIVKFSQQGIGGM